MPERVEREPAGRLQAGALDGVAEAMPDVPIVDPRPLAVVKTRSWGAVWSVASRGSPSSFPIAGARMTSRFPASVLRGACFALAGELPMDADHAGV